VNLAQRLQDLARPAGTTVLSAPTLAALSVRPDVESLGSQMVKGRETPVEVYKLAGLAGTRTTFETGA
jgi:adenylate cyclase